ncbi:MAG: ferritin family protein [Desulfobacterales bacterium]|nr:ferritin family protein [Desulfobacterales bacterium]
MNYDFNANEVLIMAQKIEQNGAKFYRDAADKIADAEGKKLLLELAVMEDDHEKTFIELQKTLTEKEKTSQTFDPDNDAVLYCKSLADMRVFFEKEIDTSSIKDVLKSAIVAEKDSIVFYLGMKDLVPTSLGTDKINSIIKEEMKHIRILTNKLKDL